MGRPGATHLLLLLLVKVALLLCASLLLVAEASGSLEPSSSGTQRSTAATSITPKHERGIRNEFIHRDKLSSSEATLHERYQQAIRRSHVRLEHIAKKVRAYSVNSIDVASRFLSDFTTPVSSDQGEYLMQFQIGTPITTFHVIVDTGSDLVWVPCLPCTSCHDKNDSIFNPFASSSYATLSCNNQTCLALGAHSRRCSGSQCGYMYEYGDLSSTSGDFSTETITLATTTGGSVTFSPFAFGCSHKNPGSVTPQFVGLMGLGMGYISFISQLSSVMTKKFSYCLVNFFDASTLTSPLLFGSVATLSGSGIGTTSILNGPVPTFYYVSITGISVGGTVLSIPSSDFSLSSGGSFFDSGTTLSYFRDHAYQIIRSAFASRISLPTVSGIPYGLDLCYDISSNPNFQPPSFNISFSGASLSPPAANYFFPADTYVQCLALGNAGTSGFPTIIGNLMQQNYHVLYDLTTSEISFQQTSCGAFDQHDA